MKAIEMKTLTALLFATSILACNAQRKAADATVDAPPPPSTNTPQVPTLGGPGKADSLVITLQRTPCFGTCPAFVINVYRSGYATYEGHSHVEREGLHSAWIGPDTLQRILKDAEASGFFQFEDRYDRDVTDLPSAILRVVGNGKDKRVVGRVGVPPAYKALFGRVEELLLPIPWKPVPLEP